MKKTALILGGIFALLLLLYYTPGSPPSPTPERSLAQTRWALAEVSRADQARLAAMMAGDGAALAELLSDRLRFVHSDGRIESKEDYVKNMLAGDTAYADARTSDVETLQPSADVVVVIGAQEMRKRLGPNWSTVKLRYMAVWRNEAGAWRMFAWQSMRPAGNSVVPK